MSFTADIQEIVDQLDAAERDAQALTTGLTEERGNWRAHPGSWSVAECIDHLATANRVYLAAMRKTAARASQQGRLRCGAAKPGWLGACFIRLLEPPAKRRLRAPASIKPRNAPPLADALACFVASQNEVRAFLRAYGGLDLARVRFPNPFIRSLRFSLATGLHVIAAHERRHLWQAWRTRNAAESARE